MTDQAASTPAVTPPVAGSADALADRVREAFAAEERAGLYLATQGRVIALGLIAVLLLFLTPFPGVLYYHALLLVFIATGLFHAWLASRGLRKVWHGYAFAFVDFGLLSFTLLVPNPYSLFEHLPQMGLRTGNFIYFFVLLSGLAFTYHPRQLFVGGVAGALMWSLGVLWIVARPETTIEILDNPTLEVLIETMMTPTFVDLGVRLQEIVVFLITAGILAVIVYRSRRMVLRQAEAERERGNLARYFPATMVEQLAQMDAPLAQVREQEVAVLFADVVGFTAWSEKRTPSEVIAFLREVHARFEAAVFEHGGTLDKFIGDGIMATFGTPETGPRDAADALGAARAILRAFDDWNTERERAGEEPVRISVGVHYGPVVTGDIGSERRLEFAVLGDTVNLASRLEHLTRELGCQALISDAAVRAAKASEGEEDAPLLDGLTPGATERVRGREERVDVWMLGERARGEER